MIFTALHRSVWLVAATLTLLAAAHAQADQLKRIEIVGVPDVALVFAPNAFAVAPGQRVELTFVNQDSNMDHNLLIVKPDTIDDVARQARDLGADGPDMQWIPETDAVLHASDLLAPGQSQQLTFTAPQQEGAYPFVCTLPGHAEEMRGIMHVMQNPEQFGDGPHHEQEPWPDRYQRMDTGPFYSGAIELPDHHTLDKGLTIHIGDEQQAAVHFDTDLLRFSAAWKGALEFYAEHDQGTRNDPPPSPAADPQLITPAASGWTLAQDDVRFHDPREHAHGPMPERHGRYDGLYIHQRRVVLAHTVHGTAIEQTPWVLSNDHVNAFTRDIRTDSQHQPLAGLLFKHAASPQPQQRDGLQVMHTEHEGTITAAAMAQRDDARLRSNDDHAYLHLDPAQQARTLRVLLWQGPAEHFEHFLQLAGQHHQPDSIEQLKQPADPLWDPSLSTRGHRSGAQDAPYVVDYIDAPIDNPHNAIFRFTGLWFTEQGDGLLTTMHGDLWRVRGLGDDWSELHWTRVATGLNNPFGVVKHEGAIYVSEEDQLTILHDRNGDGHADHHQSFRNLIAPGPGAWRQAFGLEVDDQGYFYFFRGRGRWGTTYQNGLIRISPDAQDMQRIATGFRQPWAMGMSPDGRITVSQQEGIWTPQTPVHKIDLEHRQTDFYGFNPDAFRNHDATEQRDYEPPIVWMPRYIDNSGGGQVWVASDDWGLPAGQMLHISHGHARLYHLVHEKVHGDRQGAVVPLTQFNLGGARIARFHPQDGQLYVIGIYGDGSFNRIRHTGRDVHHPITFNAHENGLRLRFQHPLDPKTATDPDNYTAHRWNYDWSEAYGSDFFSLENPDQVGQDPVAITAAHLSDDQRELFLEIPEMAPAMQMRITYDIQAENGTAVQERMYSTIHHLRPPHELPASAQ